jgi:RND superfamily putative drug exporter
MWNPLKLRIAYPDVELSAGDSDAAERHVQRAGESMAVPRIDREFKPGALYRWGAYAARNKWKVLGAWFAFLVIFGGIAFSLQGEFNDRFTLPGADSQKAYDLLEEKFPAQSGEQATIVFQSDQGLTSPEVQAQITATLDEVAAMPEVAGINDSPLTHPSNLSADGTIGYATVQFKDLAAEYDMSVLDAYIETVDSHASDTLRIEQGGPVVTWTEGETPGGETGLALAAAAIVLMLAFGSVIAMGLPLLIALAGLAAGFFGVFLATNVFDIATFTPGIAAMIGLGVGIDYSLFIVTRFREGLHKGISVEESVARAMDTAGRAVLFAGIVVVIAVLGMASVRMPFITAYAVAVSLVVGFTIAVAMTLLPAMLGIIGRRIDKWGIKRLQATASDPGTSIGTRLGRRIQQKPALYAALATGFLLLLAAPILDINLGFTDASTNDTSFHSRRAYDLLEDGFGPGFNNPALIAIEGDGPLDPNLVNQVVTALQAEEGVAVVNPPIYNGETGTADVAVISFAPTMSIQDDAAIDLVDKIRDETLPPIMAGTGDQAYVGGLAASFIDFVEQMLSRTPLFFAIVVGLSFLLLAVVFRSVVIALKAAIMNLLSIAAAFGVVVAIFQWGWLGSLVGASEEQPILAFMPMFLFSILFGLSMDYEVFLMSRIREAYVHGKNTPDAVVEGLGVTARVITAAAAIMVVVFLSFVVAPDPILKQFGVGLAVAIFVDATVVRMILVPAVMELMGEWNWWFPKWLDRSIPHVNVEGSVLPVGSEAAAD